MADYSQALTLATEAMNNTRMSLTVCSATTLVFIIALALVLIYLYRIRKKVVLLEKRIGHAATHHK